MANKCDGCSIIPIHPDKKCCFNCARADEKCEVWHTCGKDCPGWEPKPLTNAEFIRSMTDKELATFLAKHDVKQAELRLRDAGVAPTANEIQKMTDEMTRKWFGWLSSYVTYTGG